MRCWPAAQDLFEGLSKFWTEDCVNERVERGIEISQPLEELKNVALDTAFADGHYQGYDEEREPAENECTGHDGQGFGRLFLPFRLQADMLLLFFSLWSVRIVRQVVKRDIVCLRCTAGQLGPFSIPVFRAVIVFDWNVCFITGWHEVGGARSGRCCESRTGLAYLNFDPLAQTVGGSYQGFDGTGK